MRPSPIALALFIVLAWPALGFAQQETTTPQLTLRNAQNAYAYGDYRTVISSLTPILEPDILLADANDQAAAYELLGLAHFFLEERAQSKLYFSRLVRLRPHHVLDPVRVPPPAISHFDAIKAELKPELEKMRAALEAQKEAEERRRKKANLLRVERDVRINSKLIAALPLGAGQFQNGDSTLGGLFLGSQLLTGVASITCYALVENLRGTDGRFRPDDAATARQLQTAQITTGASTVLLMVIGATQALLNFKSSKLIQERTFKRNPEQSTIELGPSTFIYRF